MPDFRVVWQIDIWDAETHEEAARRALAIQRDPNSIATVFSVYDPKRETLTDAEPFDITGRGNPEQYADTDEEIDETREATDAYKEERRHGGAR
jgi:hypothetical protein